MTVATVRACPLIMIPLAVGKESIGWRFTETAAALSARGNLFTIHELAESANSVSSRSSNQVTLRVVFERPGKAPNEFIRLCWPAGYKTLLPHPNRGNTIFNRIRELLKRDPDRFLQQVSGVIHVGANIGQERDVYEKYGLRVIWIEPIPEIFEMLKANLEGLHRQRAFQKLVTDRDDAEYRFHIANNHGASSSILDLKQHKDIWPSVGYIKTITLKSMTLASLLQREQIDPTDYDALIMDTQGSELLVLEGAHSILHNFKYIKTEVPNFESYAGCCQLTDIDSFLTRRGYKELSRNRFASRAEGGSYYDIVYRRIG